MMRHTENTPNDCIFCVHAQSSGGESAYCRYFGQGIVNPRITLLRAGQEAQRFQTFCRGFQLEPGLKDKWERLFGPAPQGAAMSPPPAISPPPLAQTSETLDWRARMAQPAPLPTAPSPAAPAPASGPPDKTWPHKDGGWFSFDGRIGRKRFVQYALASMAIYAASAFMTGQFDMGAGGLAGLVATWLALSAAAKRFRSIGVSPWWAATWFVPPLGFIAFCFLLFAAPGSMEDKDA